jgi:RNase P/RNase MRP subunit p30
MPPRKRKPRGSRGACTAMMDGSPSSSEACDLMVLMPKDGSKLQCQLQIKEIIQRLASTGFTRMALTHTIYGRPRPIEDRADVALPKALWITSSGSGSASISSTSDDNKEASKKRKRTENGTSSTTGPPIRVLRRLHAVLENLSDVGIYLSNGPQASFLNDYDLVSVSPKSDATFQSACVSATMADIITLDYTGRGFRLPFKIRPFDVQAVIDRGAAFEIPFAPALLHSKQRKALVQTCRELQTSCLGKKPLILFSSGDRTFEENDTGAMALRMPGDLTNLLQTVLHFDPATSIQAVRTSSLRVLKRAEDRRWGNSDVADVTIGTRAGEDSVAKPQTTPRGDEVDTKLPSNPSTTSTEAKDDDASDNGVEDGYIEM